MGFMLGKLEFVGFVLGKLGQLYGLYTYAKGAVKDRQITPGEWGEIEKRVKEILNVENIREE